jgi:hypothetical protein
MGMVENCTTQQVHTAVTADKARRIPIITTIIAIECNNNQPIIWHKKDFFRDIISFIKEQPTNRKQQSATLLLYNGTSMKKSAMPIITTIDVECNNNQPTIQHKKDFFLGYCQATTNQYNQKYCPMQQ